MNGQFVVAIQHLECLSRLAPGILLASGLRLTNDARRIDCLTRTEFRTSAGMLEVDYIAAAPLLAYTEIQDFAVPDGQTQILLLLDIVNNFLNELWLYIEHTAFYDRGYLMESRGVLHSHTQLSATYDHEGKRRLVKVTRKDLDQAKLSLRMARSEVVDDYSVRQDRLALGAHRTAANREIELASRFSLFVQYARQTQDSALRIAFICSALEVLFSTGTSELTHRVSERVAFLIGSDAPKRQALYGIVKRLYGVRSAFLHGDSIKKADQPNLTQMAREGDQLLRVVTVQINTNPLFQNAILEGKDALERFHTAQLFR